MDLREAAISADPSHTPGFGSVVLRYRATVFHALYAAVMVHDTGHPIAFHMDAHPQPKKFIAGSREGIWWLPSDAVTDYLILTNTGDKVLNSVIVIYDSNGIPSRQNVTLSPRQTQRLSVRSQLQHAGLGGSYGGIEIDASNGAGYLDTAHLIFDEVAGFGAIMEMFQHHPLAKFQERAWGGVRQWTTRAPMLALANPDPALAFPLGTQLQPKVFVRNASAKGYTADIRFNWYSGTSSGKSGITSIALKPHETRLVDVLAFQSQGLLPMDARWSSVIVSAPVQPDELTAVAASYDTTLRYGTQTPFNDQLAAHWEGGKWEVDATHDSIITAGNGGIKPTRAQVTLFFNGGTGKYQIEQSLSPDEQLWLDLGQLIRNQVPDKDGNMLPKSLTSGTYQFRDLTDPGVGNIFEGKVITDKTFGNAAYGCMICCGYPYGTSMWTDPLLAGVNDTSPQDVAGVNACTGTTDPIGWSYPTWWTGNSSIAIASSAQQIKGMSLGLTSDFASGQINVGDGMTYVKRCPMQSDGTSGAVNVNPTIQILSLMLNPTTLTSSGTVTLTVQMQLLGTVTGNHSVTVNVSTGTTNPPGIGVRYDGQSQESRAFGVGPATTSPVTQTFTVTPGATFATGTVLIGASLTPSSPSDSGITIKDPSPASNAQVTLHTTNP